MWNDEAEPGRQTNQPPPIMHTLFRPLCLSSILLLAVAVLAGRPGTAQAQDPLPQPVDALAAHAATDVTDARLVETATALLTARAEAEISFRRYREGVDYFREHYPDFYGAFFGDPFFYRAENVELVRKRQLVNLDLSSWTSLSDDTAFRCHPYAYDPHLARYGSTRACRGFSFPVSEFSVYPDVFPQPGEAMGRVRTLPPVPVRTVESARRAGVLPNRKADEHEISGPTVEPASYASQSVNQEPDAEKPNAEKPNVTGVRVRAVDVAERAQSVRPVTGRARLQGERSELTEDAVRARIRRAYDRRQNREHMEQTEYRPRSSSGRSADPSPVHRGLRKATPSTSRGAHVQRGDGSHRAGDSSDRPSRPSRSSRGSQ